LIYAVAFSAFVIVLALVTLGRTGWSGVKEAFVVTSMMVAGYFIIGIVAGAVVGILLPLGKTRLGAAILGFVGASVVYGGARLAMDGPVIWWPRGLVSAVAMSAIIGPVVGLIFWKDEEQHRR
jgi:hypothetical protein